MQLVNLGFIMSLRTMLIGFLFFDIKQYEIQEKIMTTTKRIKNTDHYNKIDPSTIDKIVASNIKKNRLMLGLSQADVAKAIGVSPQQVQKYEKEVNRISNGRLYKLSKFFNTPIAKFYIVK